MMGHPAELDADTQAHPQICPRDLFYFGRAESFSPYGFLCAHHAAIPALASLPRYVSGESSKSRSECRAIPGLTRPAAWGLIALLIAVFPANIHMALHPDLFPEFNPAMLWLRLPLQAVLVVWAYSGTHDLLRRRPQTVSVMEFPNNCLAPTRASTSLAPSSINEARVSR